MKKSLFLMGLFALVLNTLVLASAQQFTILMDPVNQGNVTNSTALITATASTDINPLLIRGIPYFINVATGDTIVGDTIDYTIPFPGSVQLSFLQTNLTDSTTYRYNVKGIDAGDAMNWEWGDFWYMFTTEPNPRLSQPVGSATATANSITFTVTGDAVGYIPGWTVKYGFVGNGFPYTTTTEYVTGYNQVRTFTASGTSPDTTYWYRVLVTGDMGQYQDTVRYITTPASSFAEAGEVTITDEAEDSVTVHVQVTLGTSGLAEVKFMIYDTTHTQLITQSPGWISINQNGMVSHRIAIPEQGVDYSALALVRDVPNIDSSAWENFSSVQVPLPTVVRDSVIDHDDGVTVYTTVNPNGNWSGSTTTWTFTWWSQNLGDTVILPNITLPSAAVHTITSVPLGTTGYYRACASNNAGTVCTATYEFHTRNPYASVQIFMGPTQVGNSSVNITNSPYICAPGDTADLFLIRGLVSGNYPDTTYVGQIYGTNTIPSFMEGPLLPNTDHFLKYAVRNSDQIWNYSQERQIRTLSGNDAVVHLSFPNNGSDGSFIQYYGETGGYESTLDIYVYQGQSTMSSWQQEGIPIGYDVFNDTVLVTGLIACTDYRVQACINGHPSGIICLQEYTQTIGCSTGIADLASGENPMVTAYNIMMQPVMTGRYHDVVPQLGLNTMYILHGENGISYGTILKQ